MGIRQEIGLLLLVALLALPALWQGRPAPGPSRADQACQRPVEVGDASTGPAQVICLAPGDGAAALRPVARALPPDCPAPAPARAGMRFVAERAGDGSCELTVVPMEGMRRILLGLGLDPNRASAADLEALPNIGPVLASRIVTDRTHNGPFRAADDLERVKGIGPKTLQRIRPFLRLELDRPD